MEGIIWKWTNYWAGWQPRWFVLEDGALSYYKSQDEVNQSCKGSIKMSVCEIIVHPTDANRLDLVIPSEQHFYLRLATPQERQQWLVALGSAKASLSARHKKKKNPEAVTSASVAALVVGSPEQILKSRTSELRLYCDLLMQQVHMVKSAATDKKPPDIEVLNDATSLLGATCDTFIKALEDCMRIASASLSSDPSQRTWIDSTLLSSSSSSSNNCRSELKRMQPTHKSKSTGDRSPSPMLREHCRQTDPPPEHWQNHNENLHHLLCETDPDTQSSTENDDDDRTLNDEFEDAQETHEESQSHCSSTSSSDNASRETKSSCPQAPEYCNGDETKLVRQTSLPPPPPPPPPPRIKTFFSNLEVSFLNMKLTADGGIPTKHFLESCAIVITIFEMFGSPIFAPMKMDVNGNLRKIRDKHLMNAERFYTLQSIIVYEMDTGTTFSRNAATDAIMWLKRGLEFVHEFLREFHRGNMDLKQCALFAYNRTLKQYHGWIVRNIISTATRTVPCREEVLFKLALKPDDVKNPYYEGELVLDAKRFTKAMETIIRILNDFYLRHNLERKEVI